MSETMNNIDELFGMDILNETVIEESTIPKTDEGTGTPKLQETFPEVKIPVPEKTELTASVYNDALAKLKNLMKESAEIMQSLVDVEIVQESVETLQERFTEEVINEAIFESYNNGPYFEAVTRDDKVAVKEIVDKIKAKIKQDGGYKGDKYNLFPVWKHGQFTWLYKQSKITRKSWQIVGTFIAHPNELPDAIEYYNKKFKDILGDYTFNAGFSIAYRISDGVVGALLKLPTPETLYILTIDNKREDPEVISITKKDLPKEEAADKKDDDKK